MGASLVIGVDSNPTRPAMTTTMGADVVIDDTQEEGVLKWQSQPDGPRGPSPHRADPDGHRPERSDSPGYAASDARYGSQDLGRLGAATVMNTDADGGRGLFLGNILISPGRWSPLRELHGAHEVTTFSHPDPPPRLRGTTWSTVRSRAGCGSRW